MSMLWKAFGSARTATRIITQARGLSFGLTSEKGAKETDKARPETSKDVLKQEKFARRHIGPSAEETAAMLKVCGVESTDELISKTIPADIRLKNPPQSIPPLSENELANRVQELADMNKVYRSYLGQGYYGCMVPPVIKRNVIENPGWITQYTPYQAELAQGRLESLMNYQTMIVDLTGLDIANASLLDEGTAAAEAVTLSYRMFRGKRNKYFIDEGIHSNSLAVIKTRAKFLNIDIVTGSYEDFVLTDDVCGVMLQYPNNNGIINNYNGIIQQAKGLKIPVAMATDLLALTLLKSPGELGASIAFGNSQRFGVPMGCGGPHAAFFAVKDELKKQMPGRLVGKSW